MPGVWKEALKRDRKVMVPSVLRGFGGAEGIRTPDLQSAILALSQLSYCPTHFRALGIEINL